MFLVAGIGAQSALAAGSTKSIDLKQFTPDSVLNTYWMYMDSTITASNGDFKTADQGKVGAGSWLHIPDDATFKTPTMIGGSVTATGGDKRFDSSLWVLGNARFSKTLFPNRNTKVQVDGNLYYSTNGGTDSSETWVGGNDTVVDHNATYANKLHVKGMLVVKDGSFKDSVYVDPTKVDLSAINPWMSVWGDFNRFKRFTTTYDPPFSKPVFFNASKLPGYDIKFTLPTSPAPEFVNGMYWRDVCGNNGVVCADYPGISYNGKSLAKGLKVLPPGYYGAAILNNETLVLGEGVYYFDFVGLNNTSRLIAYQPTGDRTIIYAKNGFITSNAGGMFVGSDSGYIASKFGVTSSPDDFSGGTVMIVAGPGKNIEFGSDAPFWATLSAPTGRIKVNSQITLYGQMFARHFNGDNSTNRFNGGAGRFIPFYSDKPVVSFGVNVFGATVTEGDTKDGTPFGIPDTVVARFPLKMSHINGSDVTVWYHTEDVTARTDGWTWRGTKDYQTVKRGSVVIPSTGDTASILINVLGDLNYEDSLEYFRVVIDSVSNGSLGSLPTDSFGIGAIRDNERELFVRLVASGPVKLTRPGMSSSDTAFHYKLQAYDRISGKLVAPKVEVSARLKLVPRANAVIGTDMDLLKNVFTFNAGESSIDVRVDVPKGDIFKPDAVFDLVIDSASGARLQADTLVTSTVVSPAVQLVIGDGTADQSKSSTLGLPVQLLRQSDGVAVRSTTPLPFKWSTIDSSAKAGVHYGAAKDSAATFPAGALTDSVYVSLIRNALVDSTRSFKAELVPGSNGGLSTARDTGVGTILSGWDKPRITVNDTVVRRQKTDFVLKVPVRLNRGMTFKADWEFKAVDGGAVNGVDYVLSAGKSSISDIDTVRITIKGASSLDSARSFVLTIPKWDVSKLATVAEGSDTAATITLLNAVTYARIEVDSATANQSTDAKIRFPVRLVDTTGNPLATRISVPYVFSTIDGSAKGGTHFVAAASSPDAIPAGDGRDTFDIALIQSQKYDTTRHFQVDVAPVSGTDGIAVLHDSAMGTIVNGYARPTIRIDQASIVRPAVKTPLPFRITLDRASAIDLPFSWSTRDGSAISDTDYIKVDAIETTIRDTIYANVSILARPGEYDSTRRFHVDLSKLDAFANTSATAPGIIVPTLGAPYLWVLPASVEEGPAGRDTQLVFTVELRDSTGATMTSRLATIFKWSTDASYTGNGRDSLASTVPKFPSPVADYDAVVAASDTIVPFADRGTFSVRVHGNDVKQRDRVLRTMVLASPTNARLDATGSANIGMIFDDDSITTRAYFPLARDTVSERDSLVWVQVLLNMDAIDSDSLFVTVNERTTGMRDTNYTLLQPEQMDIHDTAIVPTSKTDKVLLLVAPGDSVFWFPVRIRHDSVRTADIKVVLDLSVVGDDPGVKVDPGRAQMELNIINIDPPPYLGFRDTALTVKRGDSVAVTVGVRPLRSDKDPSAQYTGTLVDTQGGTTPAWTAFVKTDRDGSTPTFTRMTYEKAFQFVTLDDGRDGPELRVVLGLHDWTPGEALQPLAGDTVLHDSVVIRITNSNAPSKAAFWTDSVTVKDADGQLAVKVLLDRASNWNTAASVTRTGEAKDVEFAPDSSVRVTWLPGDTVATFVVRFGNDHKVGSDRRFDLHLGDFLHLGAGKDSVLHVRILNTNSNPVVKITSPSEGAKLGKKDLDSLGKVPVTWTVDGNSKPAYDTLLPEGPSTIVKCYSDEWGNTGCDSVHVTLDTTPPTVVITAVSKDGGKTWLVVSPTDTPWVNTTDVKIKWISIEKGDTTRHEDGETLRDSINKVVRCIEDEVGNQGCGSGLVGLDTIPPKVWIETPPDGSHWSAGCIGTVWYEVDGKDTLRHDTTLCYPTTGPQVISVTSKPDRAGNVGKATSNIVIDPNEPSKATYVDTDNDGRIDAVIVQFPRAWIDSMPKFDISYGAPGENQRKDLKAVYGDKSQAGVEMTLDGKTYRVVAGIPARDADGRPLRDIKGQIIYQTPGGKPLLDSDGKQVMDNTGAPLWQVVGKGADSSVLVVKLDPALKYGWTTSSVDSLGVIHAIVTELDNNGKPVTKDMSRVFDIEDGVAPVIVTAKTERTEDYDGRDVLTVKVSEPIVLDSSGNWFEIKMKGSDTWVKVPAESLRISDDGLTVVVFLPPGEDGVPDPQAMIRFLEGVYDASGNHAKVDGKRWEIEVQGDPRKPRLDVEVFNPVGTVSSSERSKSRNPGFVITATNGGNREDYSPWRPGQGYLGNSGDQEFRDICPDIKECNGLEIEVNHPMRVQVYVYDLMGTYAGGFSFRLTQEDLDDMNPDKLDRYRIRILWNQRGKDKQVVASGIYPWRIVSWVERDPKTPPVLTNTVVKLGVRTTLD